MIARAALPYLQSGAVHSRRASASMRAASFFAICFASAYWQFRADRDHDSHFWNIPHTDISAVALAAAALAADYFVLHFHFTTPPHPKFLLRNHRKLWIIIHVFSGGMEILALLTAFVAVDPTPWAKGAAVWGWLHATSSMIMVPIVFGQKTFMVPLYTAFILMHFYWASCLFFYPTSWVNLLSTFTVLHTYTWVRVQIFLFKLLNAFVGYEYSVAVVTSGYLGIPSAMGEVSKLLLVFAPVLFHYGIEPILAIAGLRSWDDGCQEARRERFAANANRELVAARMVDSAKAATSRGGGQTHRDHDALFFFLQHVKDTERWRVIELRRMCHDLDSQPIAAAACLGCAANELCLDARDSGDICKHVKPGWRALARQWSKAAEGHGRQLTREEQARIFFNAFDSDGCGVVETRELESLFKLWGMQASEARQAVAQHGGSCEGGISFSEFERSFAPLWEYGYSVIEAGHTRTLTAL